MSNTRTLAIVAVLTAATLVVGVTFAATAAQSAFAYKKDDGKNNGNTITAQVNKQKGTQSGFDNTFEQEALNLICTHPNATCVSEGAVTNQTSGGGGEDNNGEDNNGEDNNGG